MAQDMLDPLHEYINGNPFVICCTRRMIMGTKTYVGTRTIHWTTEETDSDGKTRTVHHSETLTASVTKPYPEYHERTWLIYGNTAAPDLIFYRRRNGLAGKEDSLAFKWAKHKLKRKARDLSNADFAMMTNEEFETIFNTSDRNNNQQYALLFTPLAQENMTNLLNDRRVAYGDDFDFEKINMINVITPEHMQKLELDMNPELYHSFDYDEAEKRFYDINAEYFRAIYFSLAPLLCIPMYQQIRPREAIYGRDMARHSAFWEHEALANFWGQDRFMHPDCATDCILKTEQEGHGDLSTITVRAHGHRTKEHVTYVSKYGGDGRYHDVPVYWDEYIPVVGEGSFVIKEDNSGHTDAATSQTERIKRINEILSGDNLSVYRRHIASKC